MSEWTDIGKREQAQLYCEYLPTNSSEGHMSEKATIRRMAAAGYSDVEIGQHIGRDRQYVGRRRRELRIQPGQHPALRAMVARLNIRRRIAIAA